MGDAADRVRGEAAVRRAGEGAGLSVPLHPPGRDLQQPPHRRRRDRRHLQVEGLPDRGAWPLSDHDAVDPRVHPTLPDARAARGLPPHPHYGLVASRSRAANIALARELLAVLVRCEQQDTSEATAADEPRMLPRPCPCCGGRIFIIETFARGSEPKLCTAPATAAIRIDTS